MNRKILCPTRLSRPTSAATPESANSSGTNCGVNYTYDNNSNLQTVMTPVPNQTTCTSRFTKTFYYDGLNRLTKKTYSDGSPTIQYGYDGVPLTGCTTTPPSLPDSNPKGRLTSMCDGSGATSWAHDAFGHVLTESRTILGITKTISYTYNLDGSIATVTYPGSKVVTYTVSNAQRLTSAKDLGNGTQFAIAASYAPPGALQGMIAGQISNGFGGITESHGYSNKLEYTSSQATSSAGTALNLSLNYNLAGGDNGTLTSIPNGVDPGRTQSFTYDPLNRILSAQSSATSGVDCWGQTFGPDGAAADDAVANLTNINSGTQASPTCPLGRLVATTNANNHITTDSTYAYDAPGNMTQDGSGYTYTFDDDNHLILASGMTGGPYCYVYDGNGLRVAKKSGATTCASGTVQKLYWRSISGDALAETDSSGNTTNAAYAEFIFFYGRRIASRNGTGGVFYYFADQLGSTRTITTGSGSGQTPGQLCYDADFTPYGQEISHTERLQTTACPTNYKFTGYERDPETGLDYAFARYYSSRLGRFISVDPLGGNLGDPQSFNGYAYVLNNPANLTDPSGLCGHTSHLSCKDVQDPRFPDGGGDGAMAMDFFLTLMGLVNGDELDILKFAYAPEQVVTGWSLVGNQNFSTIFIGGCGGLPNCFNNEVPMYDTIYPNLWALGFLNLRQPPGATSSGGGGNSSGGRSILDDRANALANALNKTGVQSLGNPCTVGAFYLASAVGGAATSGEVYAQGAEAATTYWPQALSQVSNWLYRQALRGGPVANFILNIPKNYNKAKAAVLGGCNAMQ